GVPDNSAESDIGPFCAAVADIRSAAACGSRLPRRSGGIPPTELAVAESTVAAAPETGVAAVKPVADGQFPPRVVAAGAAGLIQIAVVVALAAAASSALGPAAGLALFLAAAAHGVADSVVAGVPAPGPFAAAGGSFLPAAAAGRAAGSVAAGV